MSNEKKVMSDNEIALLQYNNMYLINHLKKINSVFSCLFIMLNKIDDVNSLDTYKDDIVHMSLANQSTIDCIEDCDKA
jgi:hypothetical protein